MREGSESAAKELEEKLKKQAFDFKLETAVQKSGAKNAKAVKAMLNMEKISLDGEYLLWFDDQLKTLQESDDYLFGKIEVSGPQHQDGDPPKFFTHEQVLGMSQEEVKKNMDAIDKSMEKW